MNQIRSAVASQEAKVGVVIPAFNAEPWIGETLRSVLGSDFPAQRLDIVVMDDGSTDGTVWEAKRVLEKSRVSWRIQSGERIGPGRARNLGARHVQGEWLQFLDADDVLHKRKLTLQMSVAMRAAPDVALVYSPWASLSPYRAPAELRQPKLGPEPVFELLQTENFMATGSHLVNRSWFDRIGGFPETHWFVEDVEMLLHLAMAGGQFVCAASDQPLFHYRRHMGSLSRQNATGFVEGCVRNAQLAENYLEARGGVPTPKQRRILLRVYGHALRAFYKQDRGRFNKLLRHVERLEPGYRPVEPARLKWVSHLIGYRRAEAAASAFRQAKRWW